jgi:chemotaxis protein histidine kinase CheA
MTDAETDPLLELFRAELREQSAVLSRGLLQLEAAPENLEPVEGLIQAAHALRGAARIVHLDIPARLAAGLEELLVGVRDRRRPLRADDVELCLRVSDALAALGVAEPAAWAESRAADIAELNEALASESSPPSPSMGEARRPFAQRGSPHRRPGPGGATRARTRRRFRGRPEWQSPSQVGRHRPVAPRRRPADRVGRIRPRQLGGHAARGSLTRPIGGRRDYERRGGAKTDSGEPGA